MPGRIVGVDALRGLAVLGMITAHVGPGDEVFWSPTGWLAVVDGRSAATFALLAGLSAGLISRREDAAPHADERPHGDDTPSNGDDRLPRADGARVRILTRAAVLWPVGILLIALGTPVVVILPSYAVMFAALTLVLTWPPGRLMAAAAVVAVLGPVVVHASRDAGAPEALDVLVGDFYPAVAWMAYLLVGLAVSRLDLRSTGVRRGLLLAGALCAVVGYGTGALAVRVTPEAAHGLLVAASHADTTTEIVGNIGVTLVLLAVLLRLGERPALVAPLAATGALALTVYVGHIVAIAIIGDHAVREATTGRLVAFIATTVVFATAWRTALGRGPLERLLHGTSSAAADLLRPVR